MSDEYLTAVDDLVKLCREKFGDESRWIVVDGYRSLALCVIDSIYSTGSHYNSVINTVARYVHYRKQRGQNAYEDNIDDLLKSFDELGSSAKWADMVGNRKPAHTKAGAPSKSEVIYQAAVALQGLGILSIQELNERVSSPEGLKTVKKTWTKLPSQSSGITFNYFMILAGHQSVKPDRMVRRFVEESINLNERKLSPAEVAELVSHAAAQYPTEARKLDHVIWRHVSGRPVFTDAD